MKKNRLFILSFLCVFFIIPLLSACKSETAVTKDGFFFDTIISITLYHENESYAIDHCLELAREYESYFSSKLPDSDISLINSMAPSPVSVHPETIDLLETALYYCDMSDGVFDITIGEVSKLWDFSVDATPRLPSHDELNEAVSHVNYQNIVIAGNTVSLLDADASIDVGGIAKGYIADRMKEYLLSEGIESGIINLGGNVLTLKEKDNKDAYHIGIQKPFATDETAALALTVTDASVVTSGNYQRYFQIGDTLYHHILDVTTGYPAYTGLDAVTIITKSSVDADALSTICFLYGEEKGLALIESIEQTEAIFIRDDGKIIMTSGMGTDIPYEIFQSH